MINIRNYLLKTKLMIIFESILIILVVKSYFFLRNIVVGILFTLYIVSILIWMISLVITVSFNNKIHKEVREKGNE